MAQAPPNQDYYNPPPKGNGGMSTGALIAIVLGALLLIALLIGGILIALLLPAVQQVRSAARRTMAMNNARQIVISMHNFHDSHMCLPRDITDDEGNKLHSWRTNLLPYIEQVNLSDSIDRKAAWDSSANSTFTSMSIPSFESPRSTSLSPGVTHFVAVVDTDTAMGDEKMTLQEIGARDGTSNTGLVIEFPESTIQWGEPRDVTIAEAIRIIQGQPDGGVVGLADGSVLTIPQSTSAEDITKLFKLDDGAPENIF